MAFLEVRWILQNTEPLGKVGKVFTLDIQTVNGNTVTVDHMEGDVMPGDIIIVRGSQVWSPGLWCCREVQCLMVRGHFLQ